MSPVSPKRPTASQFFDPLIKVLGSLCDYNYTQGVSYKQVLDAVLLEVGINPKDPPWPLEGQGGSQSLGLYRVIGYAYRNQKQATSSRPALCKNLRRGVWGLTEEGVKYALTLKGANFSTLVPEVGTPAQNEVEKPSPLVTTPFESAASLDSRDDLTWVALDLSPAGENKVEDGSLESFLRYELRLSDDHPIFIPAITYERSHGPVTIQLMQGYAFVASGLPEVNYFALEKTPYVTQVVSKPGAYDMRTLSVIPNKEIRDLRCQLRKMTVTDLDPGDFVKVVEGKYSGLVMQVLDTQSRDSVIVKSIGFRSLDLVLTLPRIFLALCDESEAALDFNFEEMSNVDLPSYNRSE